MFQNLALFQTAGSLAQHASTRQSVIALNIANADTPGYAARRVRPFADELATPLRRTRPGHTGAAGPTAAQAERTSAPISPNGNSVSLEEEMLASVDAEKTHERAMAIYRHGLNVLRNSLGRR